MTKEILLEKLIDKLGEFIYHITISSWGYGEDDNYILGPKSNIKLDELIKLFYDYKRLDKNVR